MINADCVVIGDTIAYNLGIPLACEVRAAPSMTSSHIINISGGAYHTYCIISAGKYDYWNPFLNRNLASIRNQSSCKYYVWVIPNNSIAAIAVVNEAQKHHDITIPYSTDINVISNNIKMETGN